MFTNQLIGMPFFTAVAILSAMFIIKAKKPEHILLCAAIIAAPWSGGVWLGAIKFDFRLTYAFLLGAFALVSGKSQRFKTNATFTIVIPTVGLIFWMAFSALQAYDSAAAFGDGVGTYTLNLIYFFTIIKAVRKETDVELFYKSLFLGLSTTVILALLQYKIRFFYIGFIDIGFNTFMWWRTRSTFFHANGFGMYQMLVLPILFRQILVQFRLKKTRLGTIYTLLFFLASFTLITTQNRGSWVGLAFGMMVTIFFDFFRRSGKKTRKFLLRMLVVILVAGGIAGPKYGVRMYERMFEGKNAISKKSDSRAQYDVDAYIQIKAHPLFGVGVRNLTYYSAVIFTHNLYLLMLAETGYPGLFFFLWYLVGFLIEARKGAKSKNFYVADMNMGFLAALLGLLLASYPGPDYGITAQVSSQLWIVGGLSVVLSAIDARSAKQRKAQLRQQQILSKTALSENVQGNGQSHPGSINDLQPV